MRLNNVGSTSDVITAPDPTLQPVEANDNDLHHDFPKEFIYFYERYLTITTNLNNKLLKYYIFMLLFVYNYRYPY